MDFSHPDQSIPQVIEAWSRWTAGNTLSMAGVNGSTGSSSGWPTANQALYIPLIVPFHFTVRRFFFVTGASATTGNVDVGIYSRKGTRLVSTGSTARSASTSTLQYVSLGTPFTLTPGSYYLAMAVDSGISFLKHSPSLLADLRMGGCLAQASAFPLPASATFAALAAVNWPIFGMTSTASGY